MHFFSRNKALIAASLVATGVLAACGDDVTVPAPQAAPVVVSITPQSRTMNIGETVNFAVQISGGSETTPPTLSSCSSDNSAVATATREGSACRVTAVAAGNVNITATASTGQSAAAAVTVSPAPAAISNLNVPASLSLGVGESNTIVPSVDLGAAGNTVTYSYSSSNQSIATVSAAGVVSGVAAGTATVTVTATGSGTGFANTTLSRGVQINVTPAPASVQTITVTPPSLSLAIGGSGQINTNVQLAAGAPDPTITYSSSNQAIATVAQNGVVTAVAPGNATINVRVQNAGTATLAPHDETVSVPVTVAPEAVVSLQAIKQGDFITMMVDSTDGGGQRHMGLRTMNNPNVGAIINADNVRDQIHVEVNLTTNGQRIDSIVIHTLNAQGQDARHAATHVYPGGQASDGIVGFDIRTHDFQVNTTTGAVTVSHPNGLRVFRATIYSQDAEGNVTSSQSTLGASTQYFFNNEDSWAAVYVHPARSAQGGIGSNPNFNWHGGPGAAGDGHWSIFPVFYTPGRTVQTVSTGMGFAEAAMPGAFIDPICTAARTFSPGTGLMQVMYGSSTATATRVNCAGFEHPNTNARNLPYITMAVDNANNGILGVTIVDGFRFLPQTIPQPVAIRLDYAAPTISVTEPATKWASGVIANPYSFAANSSASDAGVGIDAGFGRAFTYSGCGGAANNVPMTTNTAADIPECPNNVNATATAYTVTVTGVDRLLNQSSDVSGTFGIDNVAPDIRYTVGGANPTPGQGPGSALDTTTFTITANSLFGATTHFLDSSAMSPTDTVFGVDVDDERSGLNDASVTHQLSRANQVAPTGNCWIGGSTPGAAFVTAPTCTMANAGPLGAPMADGFRPAQRVLGQSLITGGQAYYTYRARVQDLAGNFTFTPYRRVLYSVDNPTITGLGVPGVITAAGPNAFTPNFTELVEGHFTNLQASYSGLVDPTGAADANLVFPAQLYNARFNDVIGVNGNFSIGTPFTSGVNYYTNIDTVESTAGAPVVLADSGARPDSVTARVVNAAGLSSGFYNTGGANTGVALLNANVGHDPVQWSTFNNQITSWVLGQNISQFNAPAQGLKAVVTAPATPANQNSPFTRVDFYEFVSGMWLWVGSVDGTQVGCTSPAQNCPLYIFDNGVDRKWTYRITAPVAQLNSLAPGGSFGNLGGGARRFMAIGSNGTKGRVLATNPVAPASQVQP